jgi:hypothetical protein
MRAVVVRDYGEPAALEVTDIPVPEPGREQVRIRVEAAAVNAVDIATRQGLMNGHGVCYGLKFPSFRRGSRCGPVRSAELRPPDPVAVAPRRPADASAEVGRPHPPASGAVRYLLHRGRIGPGGGHALSCGAPGRVGIVGNPAGTGVGAVSVPDPQRYHLAVTRTASADSARQARNRRRPACPFRHIGGTNSAFSFTCHRVEFPGPVQSTWLGTTLRTRALARQRC